MEKQQQLLDQLTRMKTRMEKSMTALDNRMARMDKIYADVSSETPIENEEQLKGELDVAGKDYATHKYLLERDAANTKQDVERGQAEIGQIQRNNERDIARLNEEKTAHQISLEKQKSALTDLYHEQRQHLIAKREKLSQQWSRLEISVKEIRKRIEDEQSALGDEQHNKLAVLRDHVKAKKDGWNIALATIQREFDLLAKEKQTMEEKIATVRADKEKELEDVRISIKVAREQLEIDKATLVEKADLDHQRCQREVEELQDKVNKAEHELQNFIVANEQKKKDMEEGFLKEEELLKDTVRIETEKRDYEQKIFVEEKGRKEKDINRLREEYDKKKWHWENQIRSLMMKKSVQEAEFEAERMRVDREARVSFRSLEAKRDELKQRLNELKARYEGLSKNSDKEKELMGQRWQWRRDRLWAMWQGRLEMIKKERLALQDQMDHLLTTYAQEKQGAVGREQHEEKRIDDIQQFVLNLTDQHSSQRKQKEIQLELEKTRLVAQIKECEALLTDWSDRLKVTQDEVGKFNLQFSGQLGFAERLFRDEEKESELFLKNLQNVLTQLGVSSDQMKKQDAA